MMKKLITLIFVLNFFGTVWAQQDFVPKFDGTKYYMVVYDGDKNEKVLRFNPSAAWNEGVTFSNYFDGSNSQLWVFEEPSEKPGYINVRNLNETLSAKHFLKSWSWYAYLESQSGGREGDQDKDLELIFRFKHVFDGWQALETIEKPKGLYGVDYTPGPDALNLNAKGVASFSGVKTSDITKENAVNKVFKLVEFNPMALFVQSLERGQEMYNSNTGVSEAARADFFYVLEKGREKRVFGTEADMLAYQPALDAAIVAFNNFVGLEDAVNTAKVFIIASPAEDDVKASFNKVIAEVEEYLGSSEPDYSLINGYKADLTDAAKLVDAIIKAETYILTLSEIEDTSLVSGMQVAIDRGKVILDNTANGSSEYNGAVSYLSALEQLLNEIVGAKELIATTQGFEEAKQTLESDIDQALSVANNTETTLAELNTALKEFQNDIKAYKKALEAGDTSIALENPGFENSFNYWNSVSDTDWIPYTQDAGVDGSKNMAVWNSADYHVTTYQSLAGIPNGKYQISMMAIVSQGDKISFFAQSGTNLKVQPLAFEEWTYTKRVIEVEVTDGTLRFGVRGAGENNMIPANVWGTFDDFEVKWLSTVPVQNPGFESSFDGWTSTSDTDWIPYTQDAGVDGSKNMALWNSVDYHVITSQTVNVPNGKYKVSVMAIISKSDCIALFAKSGEKMEVNVLPFEEWTYTKRSITIDVTDGTLQFGIKGSTTDNLIPANVWGTFDNFEVVRLPDVKLTNPGFEEDFAGWTKDSDTDWMPYIEKKGVDGSKSVTYWQGVDHHVSTFQTLSNLFNGEYEVSAMTYTPNDNSYLLFGSSGADEKATSILSSGGLVKNKVLAKVSDNSLTVGIKGSGENNMVPANNWIVFDNFEILMKSIIPEYVDEGKAVNAKQSVVTSVNPDVEMANKITWWQSNEALNVKSDNTIEMLTIYTLTGAKITQVKPFSNTVTISLAGGFYLMEVRSEKSFVNIEKVFIHK
jgi:hypothetical protein